MSARKKEKNINLLSQNLDESTAKRFLAWILGTFRVLVILTEMLVICAFFAKIYLDTKDSDISDQILQTQAKIVSYYETENRYKAIQKKIELYEGLSGRQSRSSDYLKIITTSSPEEIVLNEIAIDEGGFILTGTSLGEKAILQLITNLSSYEQFSNVVLDDLETSKDNTQILNFIVKASDKT